MTNLKNNLRKVVAIAICLAGTTMFVQAQTPVTIDVSTLGGTDANNNAASTESNWQYNASQKRLHLTSANGNYTLTGTNADLCFDLGSGTLFATNANVTFNGLNTKGVTTAVGCYLSADSVTITLIGDNYLEGDVAAFAISYGNVNTITSSSSGKLTAKGASYGIANNTAANFIIDGNANVSVGSTSNVLLNFTGTIKMSDAAQFTIANNTNSITVQNFEKYITASTYEWKLTNATTTNPLTDSIISVSVAPGQTGTVERVNPVPITYTITATAGTGGSISPSGNISVNVGTDQTFTFTANSGYQIDQVLIDNLNNFPAVAAGTYTFTNVQANHKIEVYFAPSTGISEVTAEKMTIYPNPTSGQLRVSGDIWDSGDREIRIYNVVGQVVFTSQLSKLSPETTIDISHLANGLYFLKVGGKMVKIVKE